MALTGMLPPGQRLIDGFPRFGEHLGRPAPPVPANPQIQITGDVAAPFSVPVADLADLPRRGLTADFHCVAGWSATDLHWEGVAFETFYRRVIEPILDPEVEVTHITFIGLDGFRSVVTIEDALGHDVLLAEHLEGRPLDGDHGAPLRVLSPSQYGYVSTKHLSRIKIHTSEPRQDHGFVLFRRHPRARVRYEERHGYLPTWLVRPLYQSLITPFRYVCARGAGRTQGES